MVVAHCDQEFGKSGIYSLGKQKLGLSGPNPFDTTTVDGCTGRRVEDPGRKDSKFMQVSSVLV